MVHLAETNPTPTMGTICQTGEEENNNITKDCNTASFTSKACERVGAGLKPDLACAVRHNGSGVELYNDKAVRPHADDGDQAQACLDVDKACAKKSGIVKVTMQC